jgi:hypothetical protein
MVELKQSRIGDKRHYKLLEDGVWFKIKTPTEEIETKIKYEELGLDTFSVRKKEASWVFSFLLMLVSIEGIFIFKDADLKSVFDIVFISLIAVFILTVILLTVAETQKPILSITGGDKSFSLLRNSPDPETVDKFVLALQEKIRNRIIQVKVRPQDKQINLNYKKRVLLSLKENHVINDKKYAEVILKIEQTHRAESSLFNFNFSDN